VRQILPTLNIITVNNRKYARAVSGGSRERVADIRQDTAEERADSMDGTPKSALSGKKTYLDIVRALKFMKKMGITPRRLIVPGFLAFCGSIFEGFLYWVLIAIIRGLVDGTFTHVTSVPVIGQFFNSILTGHPKPNPIIFTILVLAVFSAVVLKNLFAFVSVVLTSSLVSSFVNNLRKSLFSRYLTFGKLFFDNNSSGYLFEIISGFTRRIGSELMSIEQAFFQFFSFLVCGFLMMVISWQLTMLLLLVLPVFHYSTSWVIRRIKGGSYRLVGLIAELSKKLSGALMALPLIKTCNSEEGEKRRFNAVSDQVRMCQYNIDKKRAFVEPLEEILLISMALVIIAAMAVLVIHQKKGDMAGYMVFFLLLRRNSRNMGMFNKARVSVAQISGILEKIEFIFNDKNKYYVSGGKKEFRGVKTSIELRGLNFSYPGKEAVLKDITLTIPGGRTTALVGETGSGKTTLMSLIARLYDTEPGTILVDGSDIRDFSLRSLHSEMAFISQDMFLFDDSLMFNITYGLNRQPSENEIETILEKSRLAGFVKSLPEGLGSHVGDRGIKLSGGEKQRVAIARAMLKDAGIIMLDEATSALDSITERLIQEALDELSRGKTAIIVAHRLSTIERADNIVVLEGGRIIEQGSLNELLSAKGKFHEYWQKQKMR
jgi:ATP-binding cassette, subfamily B, bacterial MsbA